MERRYGPGWKQAVGRSICVGLISMDWGVIVFRLFRAWVEHVLFFRFSGCHAPPCHLVYRIQVVYIQEIVDRSTNQHSSMVGEFKGFFYFFFVRVSCASTKRRPTGHRDSMCCVQLICNRGLLRVASTLFACDLWRRVYRGSWPHSTTSVVRAQAPIFRGFARVFVRKRRWMAAAQCLSKQFCWVRAVAVRGGMNVGRGWVNKVARCFLACFL